MGGRTSSLLRFLLAATKFLHRDGYAAMTARLRGLRADLGQGFAAQVALGEDESSLTITRCLYHDVFEAEGQPQLAACCCCTQDQVWGGSGRGQPAQSRHPLSQRLLGPAPLLPHQCCTLHEKGEAIDKLRLPRGHIARA